ncbi:MAG: hypothetical protein KBD63_03185 [Bacteriovoracaceae bacterium]|nr:hypothetical protein [Bacteriovoracaceae bacterium]
MKRLLVYYKYIIFFALLSLMGLVYFFSQQKFVALYSSLSSEDFLQVTKYLDKNKISYKASGNQGLVQIAEDKVHQVRIDLAMKEYFFSSAVSYGSADVLYANLNEKINYLESQSLEIEKTLYAYLKTPIRVSYSSRIDHSDDFNADLMMATVQFKEKALKQISKQELKTISFLVSNAVEAMRPQDVIILDHLGKQASIMQDIPVSIHAENYWIEKIRDMVQKKYPDKDFLVSVKTSFGLEKEPVILDVSLLTSHKDVDAYQVKETIFKELNLSEERGDSFQLRVTKSRPAFTSSVDQKSQEKIVRKGILFCAISVFVCALFLCFRFFSQKALKLKSQIKTYTHDLGVLLPLKKKEAPKKETFNAVPIALEMLFLDSPERLDWFQTYSQEEQTQILSSLYKINTNVDNKSYSFQDLYAQLCQKLLAGKKNLSFLKELTDEELSILFSPLGSDERDDWLYLFDELRQKRILGWIRMNNSLSLEDLQNIHSQIMKKYHQFYPHHYLSQTQDKYSKQIRKV